MLDNNNTSSFNWGGMLGGAMGLGGQVLGMLNQGAQDQRQLDQQKKLNALQVESMKEMRDFNNDRDKQMAEKLGAKWQREQLEKAGLSVGLMYGKGGAGGATTGSAGGQGASGAQAANAAATTQAAATGPQMGLMMAQIANTLADTAKKNAETPNVQANTANVNADTENKLSLQNLINTEVDKVATEIANIENQTEISRRTKEYQIEKIQQESVTALLNNLLMAEQKDNVRSGTEKNRSDIEVNKAKIHQMSQQVMQAWEGLAQGREGLNQGQQKVDIEKFSQEIKANYPNIWNIAGKYINDFTDAVNRVMTKDKDYKKHSVEGYK